MCNDHIRFWDPLHVVAVVKQSAAALSIHIKKMELSALVPKEKEATTAVQFQPVNLGVMANVRRGVAVKIFNLCQKS